MAQRGPVAAAERYRWYVAALGLFMLNGLGYAALASRLPELRDAYGLTDAQLGFARTGFVVGLTATMFVAPQLVRRARARRAAPIAAGIYLLGIGLAGAGLGLWSMVGWLLVAGAANALLDIGQNVIAVRLEKFRMETGPDTRANSLLSPLEGFQAVGGVLGAAFGAATAGRVGLTVSFTVLAGVGALGAVLVFALLRRFDPSAPAGTRGSSPERDRGTVTAGDRGATPASGTPPGQVADPTPGNTHATAAPDRPDRSLSARLRAAYPPQLRRLTAMSFAALLLEGALMNWLTVVVVNAGGSLTAASTALTVFIGALCAGRLAYGPLSGRLDRVRFARYCGVLLVAGIAGIVQPFWHGPAAITLLCAAAAGLGLSNLHPFCTATVGHTAAAGSEETALGKLNRVAYTGIALEGVLIAALTAVLGLDAALGLLGLLALLFVFQAHQFATGTDAVAVRVR
ncbi:MFS transporter [Nocardia sp. NPDC024068]|uniref:MFS transporter n=1 Tax=Nocardia sp. NPDC024068 TaxID=3157197 RepID=UPI0033CAF48A